MLQQIERIEQAVRELRRIPTAQGKTHIIIHHSASPDHPVFNWGEIRRWHLARGWRDIGYHYGLEEVDGGQEIMVGRFEHDSGAHCRHANMNFIGIGICCVGNFENGPPPPEQWTRCVDLVSHLVTRLVIPRANVLGHNEVPGAATACPGKFWDMDRFRAELKI